MFVAVYYRSEVNLSPFREKLERKSKRIDMLTVCDQLKNNALLETVGGIEWVSILEDYVPTSTAIAHHCNKVRSLALQRKFIGEMTGYLD